MKMILVIVVLVYHSQDVSASMFDDLQRFKDNVAYAFDTVADKVVGNYQTITQRMRRFFADEWTNVRNQVFPGAAEMEKRYNKRVESSTSRSSSLGRASGALYFITPKPIHNITESTTSNSTSTATSSTTTRSTRTSTTEVLPLFKKKVMEHVTKVKLDAIVTTTQTPILHRH